MADLLFIDIETRSRVNLKKSNVYRYTQDPDFQILMAAWAINDGPVQIALGWEEILNIPGLWDDDVTKVAHNAQFERICFSRFRGLPVGTYLHPKPWYCTQAVAGEHGLPQSLEMVAKALHITEKSSAGSALIRFFCVPNRKGEFNRPEDHPEKWAQFIAYCIQDVETHRAAYYELKKLGGFPRFERQVYIADQLVNDRGIKIDVPMARRAEVAADLNTTELKQELADEAGILNAKSTQQMGKWVEREELQKLLPNMQKKTIEKALKADLTPDQRWVLETRQELALAATAKFASAMLSVGEDDRLRGTLKFFGAHTGRWAGKGTQVQNLPRAQFKDPADEALVLWDLMQGSRLTQTELKQLVRTLFVGPFTIVDYAAIEARVLGWLAGEQWLLKAFRDGRDVYVEQAKLMGPTYGRPEGKIAVLALGYNGAVNSLRNMGATGTDEELRRIVMLYRRTNPAIVRLWALLGDAFADAYSGDTVHIGEHLVMSGFNDAMGRGVELHLPSGRSIKYHNVKWETYLVEDENGRKKRKESWRYSDPKTPKRIGTYGGRLAENATQAVARDLLAAALVRLEKLGYPVVGHIHDEVLVEGRYPVKEIQDIMCELPPWAKGLPVDGDGGLTERYRKL